MKLLPKPANYGIQAAIYMACQEKRRDYLPVREISDHLGISFYFLAKIIQILVREEIMISYKGPNGGVSLARPADEITLKDMVSALEGEDFFDSCILGLPGCGEEKPCSMHTPWEEIRSAMKSLFESTTLADLAARLKQEDLRIGII